MALSSEVTRRCTCVNVWQETFIFFLKRRLRFDNMIKIAIWLCRWIGILLIVVCFKLINRARQYGWSIDRFF